MRGILINDAIHVMYMTHQREAIPEDLPRHPSEVEGIDEKTTIGQLMDGGSIDLSIQMKWAGSVNEYAYELTSPPGLPSKYEGSSTDEVKQIRISECSPGEIVALIGWYWYTSGDNKAIFNKEDKKAQQRDAQNIEEIKQKYSIIHRFDTGLDRVHLQALCMSIYSKETGGIDWDGYDLVDGDQEAAVCYPPNVEDVSVVIFNDGRGYYCCHSEADVKLVDEWFRAEFSDWTDSGLTPLQLDDFD
jgi:hypothetical protein